jgi:hypothetical protein
VLARAARIDAEPFEEQDNSILRSGSSAPAT